MPKVWEKVTVQTWPTQSSGITCRREFRILNEKEQVICAASTLWTLLDFKTRRLGIDDKDTIVKSFYIKKSELVGFNFFVYDVYEHYFYLCIVIWYDNKYFTINNSSYDEIGLSDEERTRPTALYMVDLENERLIYCGYSITHFENLYSKGSPIYDAQELCLKISKKEQEIK